jgi:hypothetical protein
MKTGIRAASMLTASYSPLWQSGPDRFAWRNDKYRGQGANRFEKRHNRIVWKRCHGNPHETRISFSR